MASEASRVRAFRNAGRNPTAHKNRSMTLPPPPEYRRCPATGRWVILAPERALRPIDLTHGEPHHRNGGPSGPCPLCPGQEYDTPREVYAVRTPGSAPNGPGWRVRVVPNKYPAVRPLDAVAPLSDEFFQSTAGYGAHELVIDCAEHETDPAKVSDEQFTLVFVAVRERFHALARDRRLAHITTFKNVGAEAGASLAHSHSQLVATPIIPDAVRAELDHATAYHRREKRCVYCDLIRREREAGVRVVAEADGFVAVCPFAPRFAHEVWVLPTAHHSQYEATTDAALTAFARLLKRVLGALDGVLANPAYNLFLHTGPLRAADLPHYHWHAEITPRTARAAGFEFGGGCFINAVLPERAAAELRDCLGEPGRPSPPNPLSLSS